MTRIGFANADITPAAGTPMGSWEGKTARTVHDRLSAAACVIESNDTFVAIVGIDGGVTQRSMCDAARASIAASTLIPPANVLIGASHTHTGGPMLSIFNGKADEKYTQFVGERVVEAVRCAWKSLLPAEIGLGTGSVSGIHFNRRFLMRDGREVTHPGKMHPEIIRPAGPVDPDVGVLAARDADGKLIGVIVNFACHSTVISDDSYSADYAHYLREHLRQIFSPDLPVVFLLGACGDVTQVNNRAPGKEMGHAWGNMFGATLAGEAARAITRISFAKDVPLKVVTEKTTLRLRDNPDLERLAPTLGLGSGEWWDKIYVNERAEFEQMRERQPTRDAEIQAIRIGPLGIVANGAELFCQPALDIKSASPITPTWVVTLANEYLGYVPTASAFYAGGYEPRTARSSFLAPDSAQRIVEASLRGLGKTVK